MLKVLKGISSRNDTEQHKGKAKAHLKKTTELLRDNKEKQNYKRTEK